MMSDQYKRGGYQGKGGGGGNRSNDQTFKNLERAATDIQNLLQNIKVSKEPAREQEQSRRGGGQGGARGKKQQENRGSKSMMDLSGGGGGGGGGGRGRGRGRGRGGGQGGRPPSYEDHHYRSSPPPPLIPSQHYDYQQPPQPPPYGHYNQGPPPQHGHYNPGPPPQSHYKQGPPPPPQGHYGPDYYPSTPPSYEESEGCYGSSQQHQQSMPPPAQGARAREGPGQQRVRVRPVSAQDLVKALVMFDGHLGDSDLLSRHLESSAEEVEKTVSQRKDIFKSMKDGRTTMVELVPNVRLCFQYFSEKGCTDKDTCRGLHICREFVLSKDCKQGPSCAYGHRFDTNHNTAILSKLYLDLITQQQLLKVIKKVHQGNVRPRVCSYYSTKAGCRVGDKCGFLHICKDYVLGGGKCSTKACTFSHQLNTKQCQNILDQHGMSTNKGVKDILAYLKGPLEKSMQDKGENKTKEQKENKCDDGSSSNDDDDDYSDSDSSVAQSDTSVNKKKKARARKKKDKSSGADGTVKGKKTVMSTDFVGEVEIPEICIYSVNDKCKNAKTGCSYLHAKSLFHWQVKKNNKWYNLRIFQSKALESAYRDVTKATTMLPPLEAEKLNPQDQQMLELMGTHRWTADFKEMYIVDSFDYKLDIRRVSTASSVKSSVPQATVFKWYFEDERGQWISYGDVDSLGKQNFVCSVTSQDIETEYLRDPSSTMIISNAQFKYKIDFKTMTQTNMSSQKVREIRRRPAHLAYQKTGASSSTSSTSDSSSLPTHWQPMSEKQTHVLITLDPSQDEFQSVSRTVKLTIPTAKVYSITRLQNMYLWRLMQYKKDNLSGRYTEDEMNVQKMFHGTDSGSIDSICKENIDGRRYANAKEKYGKGTYFSNSCAVARKYSTPDGQGHLFLVLAEVIIGLVTTGTKGLKAPPPNPSLGHPFDTTVDSLTEPTVFVKYDREDYYPEYIVEISV